jgi:small-conductance mechanosensitive channel
MPSKEQLADAGFKALDWTKTQFTTLKDAGLFKGEHMLSFAKDLAAPLDPSMLTPAGFQATALAAGSDVQTLSRGYIAMNAIVLFLEIIGNLISLLLGVALPIFFLELFYALTVAYLMYWLVVCSEGPDYKLIAIGLYVIYTMINLLQAMGSLVLVVPALFFFCKVVASLICALYAFKIEKLGGSTPYGALKEEDGVELGVAE